MGCGAHPTETDHWELFRGAAMEYDEFVKSVREAADLASPSIVE